MRSVLVYVKNALNTDKVLLTKSDNLDSWSLNLLQGEITNGDDPETAATNLLSEKTLLTPIHVPSLLGKIDDGENSIFCCVTTVIPQEEKTDNYDWYYWDVVKYDYRLHPSLRLLIPLMHMEVFDWKISNLVLSDNLVDASFSIQIQ